MRLLEAKLILYTERKNKKSVNKAIQILSKLKLELQNLKNANLKETGDIWDIEDNSEIIYELGVLRTYVEPLLYDVPIDSPVYEEAKRLLKFIRLFLPIPSDAVPQDSILREFIGGSYFYNK